MELPAPRHPAPGHQRPQAPWLLQPFVLTENFYPAGLPNPRPEHPFQAPPAAVAPSTPRAPPPGFQMAPCGCFFDPRVFHIEWTTTNLPSPATFMLLGSSSLPGTAPQGPQSCGPPPAWPPPVLFMPYDPQGRAAAPAPSVLPPSLPNFQHLEGQLQQMKISSTAVPTVVPMGEGIPLGSDVPEDSSIPLNGGNAALGDSVILDTQAIGDTPESPNISLPEEVLLEEAMRLFDCSLGAWEGSQDSHSSVPIPEEPSDTNSSNPCYDISSLLLPEEMLSSDYNVPEASNAILSMEHLEIRLNPEELQCDLPLLLSPEDNEFHPNTRLEKQGKKRRNTSLPKKGSKRKASAASTGVGGQH